MACTLFSGCFEIEETTVFKTADSGEYSVVVDMGQAMAQLKMFGDGGQLGELNNIDSTTNLKNAVVNDTLLSPQERQAIINGSMKMHLNKEKDEMKITLSAPFTSVQNISAIRSALFKMVSSRTQMPAGLEGSPVNSDLFTLVDLKSVGFDFQTRKGMISTKLTDSVLLKQRLDNDSLLQQVKPMLALISSPVTYKSVYNFVAPVKTVTGQKATVSDDRKKVIIINNLDELFDNLSAFEYGITF